MQGVCLHILGTRGRGIRTTARPGTGTGTGTGPGPGPGIGPGPGPGIGPEPEPGTGQSRTRVRDPVLVHMGSNYRPITARNRLWVASQKWQTSVSAVSIPDRVPNQRPEPHARCSQLGCMRLKGGSVCRQWASIIQRGLRTQHGASDVLPCGLVLSRSNATHANRSIARA